MRFFNIFGNKKTESKEAFESQKPIFPSEEEKPRVYSCAMCKKKISESETHRILSHRYCQKCATPSEKYRNAINSLESTKAAERKKQNPPKASAPSAVRTPPPIKPSRKILPTPLESFSRYVEEGAEIGPITYKNIRFRYRVVKPEEENRFWENFLSELDKMGGLRASEPPSYDYLYKMIFVKDVMDCQYPDDVDLWHSTMIQIYADRDSGGYRFFLTEMYPDPWSPSLPNEHGGEITFEEFLSCMRRMGRVR
jgi:hypothetical protein